MKKLRFCKLKTSLSRNLLTIYKHFGISSSAFLRFCCKFYLPVNTDKPKFVAFLVVVGTTASFNAQISSFENVSKRDAILAPFAKQ